MTLLARLAELLHIHIWNVDQNTGSKGHMHLVCRCGAAKRVQL